MCLQFVGVLLVSVNVSESLVGPNHRVALDCKFVGMSDTDGVLGGCEQQMQRDPDQGAPAIACHSLAQEHSCHPCLPDGCKGSPDNFL